MPNPEFRFLRNCKYREIKTEDFEVEDDNEAETAIED